MHEALLALGLPGINLGLLGVPGLPWYSLLTPTLAHITVQS